MSGDHFGDLRRARYLTLRVLRAVERLLGPAPAPAAVRAAAALGGLLHRIAVVHEFPEERRLLRAWPGHDAETQGLRRDHELTRHLAVALCTVPDGALRDPRTPRLVGQAARSLAQVDDLLDQLETSWDALPPRARRRLRPNQGLDDEQLFAWTRELEVLETFDPAAPPAQLGASSPSSSRRRRYR